MGRQKIVVLDDSETVLEVTDGILSDAGYEVIALNSWATLASTLARERPDLCLIDVSMPILSGDSVIGFMSKGRRHQVPLVLYSDRPEAQLATLAQSCGAAGYICKTGDAAKLLRDVSQFLQAPRPSAPAPAARSVAVLSDDPSWDSSRLDPVRVPTGPGAAALLARAVPSVLVVDLDTPEAESTALALRETDTGRLAPFVATSALGGPRRLRSAAACADDFVLRSRLTESLAARVAHPPSPPPGLVVALLPPGAPRLTRLVQCCGHAFLGVATLAELEAVLERQADRVRAVLADGALVTDPAALTARVARGGATLAWLSATPSKGTLPFGESEALATLLQAGQSAPVSVTSRVPFFTPVDFESAAGTGSGLVTEASRNGLFVSTLLAPPAGTEVTLRFSFSARTLECRTQVTWANGFEPGATAPRLVGLAARFLSLEGGLAELLSSRGDA